MGRTQDKWTSHTAGTDRQDRWTDRTEEETVRQMGLMTRQSEMQDATSTKKEMIRFAFWKFRKNIKVKSDEKQTVICGLRQNSSYDLLRAVQSVAQVNQEQDNIKTRQSVTETKNGQESEMHLQRTRLHNEESRQKDIERAEHRLGKQT